MNSYHKAMLNTMRSDPVYAVVIHCSEVESWFDYIDSKGRLTSKQRTLGGGLCPQTLDLEDFCLTKPAAIRIALEDGWAYDSEGKWLCPDCKKKKAEVHDGSND